MTGGSRIQSGGGTGQTGDIIVDIKRLRTFTILAPIAFLVALEIVSIALLRPTLGENSLVRLLVIFAVLSVAVVPFSFWIFAIIERQQEDLRQNVAELQEAHEIAAEHNRQLAAVNTAITSISSQIDLAQVLQNITDAARQLVRARYAALGVADDGGRILQFITSGITSEQRAAIGPLPVGHGLLGALINEGTPLRIPNIGEDPRSHGFPPNHPPMTSLLGVPIVFKGRAVGDLYLTDKIGAEEFSQEDQDLLILLANHAAVAIENARLYEDATASRDRLKEWNERLETLVAERTREIERYSREMTTRIFQAQEEERKRISRELHDDAAQSLSTLLITLDLAEPSLNSAHGSVDPFLRTSFDRVRGIAKHTLDEVRALSHDLRPTILDDFGLEAALKWYVDEYTQTFGIPVDLDIEPVPQDRLGSDVELALFRIAQEALTNSGKHAEATCARLSLSFPDSRAELVIEDNGRGFDRDAVDAPSRRTGLGLYGMHERAELLSATLEVDSTAGKGTRISVNVPLPAARDDSAPDQG